MKDKNLLTVVIVVAAIFFMSQGGLTGFSVDPYNELRAVPISEGRFAKGNVDHDPNGHIDEFDLKRLRNEISLGQYNAQADMNDDGLVDWTDYALLEDYIASRGTGQVGRGGICSPGETKCGRNLASGTGSLLTCVVNNYGVPEWERTSCGTGSRCRNGACEYKAATRLH